MREPFTVDQKFQTLISEGKFDTILMVTYEFGLFARSRSKVTAHNGSHESCKQNIMHNEGKTSQFSNRFETGNAVFMLKFFNLGVI